MSEIQHKDRIFEAINHLHKRKKRIDANAICSFMSRQFAVNSNETKIDLQKLVDAELLIKFSFKNHTSYRKASNRTILRTGLPNERKQDYPVLEKKLKKALGDFKRFDKMEKCTFFVRVVVLLANLLMSNTSEFDSSALMDELCNSFKAKYCTFLHSSCGQAVLAGDPLQLGPVVISKVAEHFGLGESLMSRLLLRVPYCRDLAGFSDTCGYNPRLVTRLVFNYRSLPEILDLPNQMFYDGDLIPKVSEDDSEEAGVLNRLRAVLPARPLSQPPALVFHGVRGTNCQAPDSPSWHNPHEAVQAAMYLQGLYSSGLSADQCGIITPYQAQVLKIRHMLETLEIPIPKVGSVEEFQGQERMAVILSTVRSSPRLLEADVRHTIGFIASPRRLNVAITRARAVLIIVGNPHLLARDQYWRTVLECCVRNGAYTGCDLPTLSVGNTDNKPEEKN